MRLPLFSTVRVDPGAIGRLDKGLGWYPLVFTRMAAGKAQDDIPIFLRTGSMAR